MSTDWLVVVVVGAATMGIKAIGPAFLGGRVLPGPLMAVMRLLAPAVLAALVVVQVVGGERQIVLDERLVGLAAAALAVGFRAPLLVTVVVAAAATAITRLLLG